MSLHDAKTPGTFASRAYTYVAFVGGLWSAQWLLWFATGHWFARPDAFGLAILAIVFLFWFFMPQRYWFRKGTPPKN